MPRKTARILYTRQQVLINRDESMYSVFSLRIASISYWPTSVALSSGKNSSPVSKVANQSLIDERGFISRLSSPHDYEKTFRNETRAVRNIFFVCVCRSISTMYSLNYRFCAAVQNTSLTNKLSATDAKDQIQYD